MLEVEVRRPTVAVYALKAHKLDRIDATSYALKAYEVLKEIAMPRAAVEDNKRMSLRMTPEIKSKLLRAAALRHTDLTNFVTQSALREAEEVIHEAEVIKVSERDYMRILAMIENPPAPNAKLLAAAKSLPKSL